MSTPSTLHRHFPHSLFALAVMGFFSQNAIAQDGVIQQGTDPKTLPTIVVQAKSSKSNQITENDITRQFPATSASITAQQAATSINVVNTEDALKYLPNVLVRTRYIGDTNAPLAT